MRLSAGLVWFVFAANAHAQARSPQDEELVRQMARQHFEAGVTASEEGRWEAARDAFTRAFDFTREVLVLLNLAVAQAELGDLVAAEATYQQFLETSDATEHASYRTEADAALRALEPRIPRVTLRLSGAEDGDEVRLDGTVLERDGMDAVAVNPGPHVASVSRDGRVIHEVSFAIEEARSIEVRLTAPLRTVGPAPSGENGLTSSVDPRDDRRESRSIFKSPWFWVVTGVVVAAGVTTGVVLATSGGSDPFTGNLPPGRWVVR